MALGAALAVAVLLARPVLGPARAAATVPRAGPSSLPLQVPSPTERGA
jgi:hypothetical protein